MHNDLYAAVVRVLESADDTGCTGDLTVVSKAALEKLERQIRMRDWSSGGGRLNLRLTLEDAESASHQGQCDDDVEALSHVPYVAQQLSEWKAEDVRAELKEYGSWDDGELVDDEKNLQRMLWLAAGDMLDYAT